MKKRFFDAGIRDLFYDIDTDTLHAPNFSGDLSDIDPLNEFPSGITTRNGSGSASVLSGYAKLTIPPGTAPGSWANVPMVAVGHSSDPWNIDVIGHINSWIGGNSSNVYVAFGIRRGSAGNEGAFINIRGDGGAVDFYTETVPGTGVQATAGAIPRGDIAGGQFWCRVSIRGAQIVTWYGIGTAGLEPSEWIMIGQVTNAANHRSSYLSNIVMTLDAVGGGSPDDVAVDFNNIKIMRG